MKNENLHLGYMTDFIKCIMDFVERCDPAYLEANTKTNNKEGN